jgi:hypothetical protein
MANPFVDVGDLMPAVSVVANLSPGQNFSAAGADPKSTNLITDAGV